MLVSKEVANDPVELEKVREVLKMLYYSGY